MIKLSPSMPTMNTAHFGWLCIGDLPTQQALFHYLYTNAQAAKEVDWLFSNSFYDIEPSAFKLTPNLLPIGPLLRTNLSGEITGNFWSEDSSCVKWLDKQAPCSVIYIAFGSITVFNQHQFHELAIGIELIDQPFLWVVRLDLTDGSAATYPDGFQERIATRGKIVSWAPQQKVLARPSVSLFITHCGWNSTMEGLSMGFPFLCWPYFFDQFLNQSYISNLWKVGLQLNVEDDEIISSAEIYKKFKDLIGDETIRTRALEMKEKKNRNLTTGGSSLKKFNDFLQAMKGR
ncbi:hypothetical protein GIB67_037732 [Kingdonia uniflora]|uniref:UDP-glycosyltransferase n=1 Tax=Kingdonia uniflora TaxID=39325 RepID=A0A7J7LV59_9MAGN|nr:hypothetical protein GIB67_037732 [Kingdonia uniflora]